MRRTHRVPVAYLVVYEELRLEKWPPPFATGIGKEVIGGKVKVCGKIQSDE
jgi:hypothetical protein